MSRKSISRPTTDRVTRPEGRAAGSAKEQAGTTAATERKAIARNAPKPSARRSDPAKRSGAAAASTSTSRAVRAARASRLSIPAERGPSALDAAAQLLASLPARETAEGLTTRAIIERLAKQGLWTSPGGKTPEATLYSAMIREIERKKSASRFRRVAPGRFGLAASAKRDSKAAGTSARRSLRPAEVAAPTKRSDAPAGSRRQQRTTANDAGGSAGIGGAGR